ncbi:MAG: SdpI family protein [Peptoniphilaceae bacterium]|uniref:SdpI family protein n=1 Tax=Parvimonas sp. TaxID=1944660 RepID=UPI0025FB52C5|nr:SdpI family protein [Parvimonas sp.]MCI5996658.1 SdpI family protein [Parvimonas sp.]MDD7764959.1 SdpI family protein [Peptoniphilaceae bacterium]MDY3050357.1 SdpI family protein [Parvimonas sp.]
MNKFLKLLIILVVTPIILATIGFVTLPTSIVAYVKNGENVYIGSYMIYTFALIDLIITFFGVTYLKKVRKKFTDGKYPTGVSVVAFINLLLSLILNYCTYLLLVSMLRNANIEIPFYVIRIVFTLVSVLIFMYGIYLRKANKDSEFAIRNKWTLKNEIVFVYVNKFVAVVFIFGAIFNLIMSWTMNSQNQLYIISLFVVILCLISAEYISWFVGNKFQKMYREKIKTK